MGKAAWEREKIVGSGAGAGVERKVLGETFVKL